MAGVQERRQLLLDDPDLSKVEAHRVFCNRCDKWLKLDETKLFAASVWRCHKNTKSHNARAPNLSASAPPPPKSEGASGTTSRPHTSASVSSYLNSRNKTYSAFQPRRVRSKDHSQTQVSEATASTASTLPKITLPRVKLSLKVPASARSDAAPISASASGASPRSASTSNPVAPSASTSSVDAIVKPLPVPSAAPTPVSSQLASGKSNASQRSMPPPSASVSTPKVPAHPTSQSTQPSSSSQNANHPHNQSANSAKAPSRVRSLSVISVPGKDKEVSSASAPGSGASVPSTERLSPHRQASYKALVAEQYIGNLEPFRAFCTLCNRWVDLSSRTPYSYGVWKGHVRKSEKHNRLQTDNAEDDYDTGSEHSQEDSGMHPSDNLLGANGTAEADGVNEMSTQSASVSRTDSESAPGTNGINGKTRASESPVDNNLPPNHASFGGFQQDSTPATQVGGNSSATPNPFALKATTEDSFGPRRQAANGDQSKGSQVNLLESDDMPVLTESSEEEAPSSSQPTHHKPSVLAALEKRRDAMLADPDAAIVEARRVQCRLCERWIKGSNTQEYSSHHWLKHKNKCVKARARESDRWSETVEVRKGRLEADPDVATLEAHRALCRLCNKWVKLCGRSRYSASHWLQHKKKCPTAQSQTDAGASSPGPGLTAPETTSDAQAPTHSGDEKKPDPNASDPFKHWWGFLERQHLSATLNLSQGGGGSAVIVPTSTDTVESRRAALLADSDILRLFPDRVQCKSCTRWIQLSMPVEYSPGNWFTHKECCPALASDSPSKLQAALVARKRALEEDPDVTELEPHRVHCGICKSWVKLRTDCSYSLGKWELHKRRCEQQSQVRASGDADVELVSGREDPGEDDREAMDVEDELKDEAGHEGAPLGAPDKAEAGPSFDSSRTNAKPNNNTKGSRLRHNRIHKIDGDGDIEMTGPQTESTGDVTQDADDEAEYEGVRNGSSCQQTTVTKPKAFEAQRRELLSDMDVLEVEPQRVLCRRCQSWVSLDSPCNDMLKHWLAHKKECPSNGVVGTTITGAPKEEVVSRVTVPQSVSRRKLEKAFGFRMEVGASRPIRPFPKLKGKGVASRRPQSPMTLPPVPSRPRWPDEDERKQQFMNDPDVLRVEAHRLLCKHCNCWIRLHPIIRYSQSIWPQHKASCKQVQILVPSDAKIRAKSEKEDSRQRLLEEDPYATDVGPHRVTCKACGTNIRLDTTYKYEGSHWRAHRARCGRIPFHERLPKKRKITEQPVAEPIAVVDSSDSSDSDASSVPRPRPTSFFTDPLVIRPTEMFRRRSRAPRSHASELAVAAAAAKAEADLVASLERLAAELDKSDRLMTIIQTEGDGVTSEELAQQQYAAAAAQAEADDAESLNEEGAPTTPRRSPTPDPDTWIPSKRTREEEEEFDKFFQHIPLPATPRRSKSKTRVCRLGKEAMQVVD